MSWQRCRQKLLQLPKQCIHSTAERLRYLGGGHKLLIANPTRTAARVRAIVRGCQLLRAEGKAVDGNLTVPKQIVVRILQRHSNLHFAASVG